MRTPHVQARLYLDDVFVGTVTLRGAEHSWRYGTFRPGEGFAAFATLFGRWSLLIHADDRSDRLSPAAAEELRDVEYAIDHVRAMLYWPGLDQWVPVLQLNIDGELIEWKQG